MARAQGDAAVRRHLRLHPPRPAVVVGELEHGLQVRDRVVFRIFVVLRVVIGIILGAVEVRTRRAPELGDLVQHVEDRDAGSDFQLPPASDSSSNEAAEFLLGKRELLKGRRRRELGRVRERADLGRFLGRLARAVVVVADSTVKNNFADSAVDGVKERVESDAGADRDRAARDATEEGRVKDP